MSQSARLETHASIQSFEELQRKLQEENSSILHERTMATRDAALSVAIRKTEDLVRLHLADRELALARGDRNHAGRLFVAAAAHRLRVVMMKLWLSGEPS